MFIIIIIMFKKYIVEFLYGSKRCLCYGGVSVR